MLTELSNHLGRTGRQKIKLRTFPGIFLPGRPTVPDRLLFSNQHQADLSGPNITCCQAGYNRFDTLSDAEIVARLRIGPVVTVDEGISAVTGQTMFVGDFVVKTSSLGIVNSRVVEIILAKLNIPFPHGRLIFLADPSLVSRLNRLQDEKSNSLVRRAICETIIYVQERIVGYKSAEKTEQKLRLDEPTLTLVGKMAGLDIALGYLDLFVGRHGSGRKNLGNLLIGPGGELVKIDTDRIFEASVQELLARLTDGRIINDIESFFLQARMLDRPLTPVERGAIRRGIQTALRAFLSVDLSDVGFLGDVFELSEKSVEPTAGSIEAQVRALFKKIAESQAAIASYLEPGLN